MQYKKIRKGKRCGEHVEKLGDWHLKIFCLLKCNNWRELITGKNKFQVKLKILKENEKRSAKHTERIKYV
jgi:hypothetical protein